MSTSAACRRPLLLLAAIALARVPTGDSRAFATVTYNGTAQASQWHTGEDESAAACAAAPSGIPAVFHRSHRFTFTDLESVVKRSVDGHGAPVPEALFRVRRNLDSCAAMNPDAVTRYYDDEQVLARVHSASIVACSCQSLHAWFWRDLKAKKI